jgi:hypothetical protein
VVEMAEVEMAVVVEMAAVASYDSWSVHKCCTKRST